MRVNYPSDTTGLASLAMIRDFRSTQQPGADYSELLARPSGSGADNDAAAFTIAIGSRIYHNLNDFTTGRGRTLMTQIIGSRRKLESALEDLRRMRARYGRGDKGLAQQIIHAEAEAASLRQEIRRLTDELAMTESN